MLQNIEFGISQVYRGDRSLLDLEANRAVEAVRRSYSAERAGRQPPAARLTEPGQRVFEAVKAVCEWRLGRASQPSVGHVAEPSPGRISPVTRDEIIACLHRIEKSIRFWTKRGGKRGYLDFTEQYLP